MKKSMVCAVVAAALVCMSLASCSKKKTANQCEMVKIPDRNFELMNTEVTQKLYEEIMGENPSYWDYNKGENNPVTDVSWYDAIYFCNKMSEKYGYKPVYSVNGSTDVSKWGYAPHKNEEIKSRLKWNKNENGFRLPTVDEWLFAAFAGQDFKFPGSNNAYEVGWFKENSGKKVHSLVLPVVHPVAKKKPNAFGFYDMAGNAEEWCWDPKYYSHTDETYRIACGSNYMSNPDPMIWQREPWREVCSVGFRIARTVIEN